MEKIFGLIGHPLTHSYSKKYFNKFFRQNNLNYEYQNYDLNNLDHFNEILENKKVFGLNVTIPFKEKIIERLNKIDFHASKINAVNTILINRTGQSFTTIGYNTDYHAFQISLAKLINTRVNSALILGSGGASKAVEYALSQLNINSTIVSRKPKENQLNYLDIDQKTTKNNLLIVNTTPLGMYPKTVDTPEIPYNFLTKEHILYDLIYNPVETLFLSKGKAAKAKVKNGMEMLKLQAQLSWRIWNKEKDF